MSWLRRTFFFPLLGFDSFRNSTWAAPFNNLGGGPLMECLGVFITQYPREIGNWANFLLRGGLGWIVFDTLLIITDENADSHDLR
jgi:hypothetical protein